MYHVGDPVFYVNTDVYRITDMTTQRQSPAEKGELYYVLEPPFQKYAIFTPVNAPNIFMRPITSKSEAEQLVDSTPTIQAKI